ncbi:MAG: hypothetical protein A3B30_00815 [Candidatus Komeilibacteria bacterium RIFCSPLOWO2_01_FULL_52_15]|uniref:Uncharacterized protein n=1 Tax=Candidatus Komeilibacteria bacterium RIFCSPLOWO2_01_FULL_52_15 TaxID=1798551 RepID=A0A1G2BPZ0_9BACT|nr:MAG: hypothetical protein A3B30_00815 [Candidatus Komeilibacteria bacterium RIFCSPLOWO2_01_FULL_52_15]
MPDTTQQNQPIAALAEQVRELTVQVKKLRRRMLYASIYEVLKLILIVGPLIFSLWYFGPQLQQLYRTWSTLMQNANQYSNPSADQQQQMLEQIRAQYPQLFR